MHRFIPSTQFTRPGTKQALNNCRVSESLQRSLREGGCMLGRCEMKGPLQPCPFIFPVGSTRRIPRTRGKRALLTQAVAVPSGVSGEAGLPLQSSPCRAPPSGTWATPRCPFLRCSGWNWGREGRTHSSGSRQAHRGLHRPMVSRPPDGVSVCFSCKPTLQNLTLLPPGGSRMGM